MKVARAYKFRCYPTREQAQALAREFGCARYVYNWALVERQAHYVATQATLPYGKQSAALTQLKRSPNTLWLKDASSVVLQQALRHADRAYVNFFRQQAGLPQFKRKQGHQSVTYQSNSFTFKAGRLTLAKHTSPLDLRMSRDLPAGATVTSVTVSRTPAGHYFAALHFEAEARAWPSATGAIGLDFNTIELVDDQGQRHALPVARLTQLDQRRKRYQRAVSRKTELWRKALGIKPGERIPKGARKSSNLVKLQQRIARLSERCANVRRDWQHKTTTQLVRENQTIVIEDLCVKGMTAAPKKGADGQPRKNVQAKRGLNRSILRTGFGELRRQLEYKAAEAGRHLEVVGRFFPSSKRCSDCGATLKRLPLNVRHWDCPACGASHDRDVNAARNILAEGRRLLANKIHGRPVAGHGFHATGGPPGIACAIQGAGAATP